MPKETLFVILASSVRSVHTQVTVAAVLPRQAFLITKCPAALREAAPTSLVPTACPYDRTTTVNSGAEQVAENALQNT
ncbi:hypothetical protein GCM10010424_28090 [Streptomyces lienomycini]